MEPLNRALHDPHREYRHCHRGGSVYLLVEGLLWLISATLGAAGQIPFSMLVLLLGGMFIHPIATLGEKLLKLPVPDPANRLPVLNTWIALTIPLGLPLIFMATAGGREHLFYPAFTVLIGAHWLPFVYIYAMKSFAVLAGLMIATGILFAFLLPSAYASCGFVTAAILLLFAALHTLLVRREVAA